MLVRRSLPGAPFWSVACRRWRSGLALVCVVRGSCTLPSLPSMVARTARTNWGAFARTANSQIPPFPFRAGGLPRSRILASLAPFSPRATGLAVPAMFVFSCVSLNKCSCPIFSQVCLGRCSRLPHFFGARLRFAPACVPSFAASLLRLPSLVPTHPWRTAPMCCGR